MYSRFAKSNTKAVVVGNMALRDASNSGAVLVSRRPLRARVTVVSASFFFDF